jgi:hypothetical protein
MTQYWYNSLRETDNDNNQFYDTSRNNNNKIRAMTANKKNQGSYRPFNTGTRMNFMPISKSGHELFSRTRL